MRSGSRHGLPCVSRPAPPPASWAVVRSKLRFQLYEHFEKPCWLQHQNFGKARIDVVGFAVGSDPNLITVQDHGMERLLSHVGVDVFAVGYPFRNYDQAMKLPVWKRGSIATEPLHSWEDRPAFLIDAASRPGMSGSPVFRRTKGPAPLVEPDGSFAVKVDSIVSTAFAGIYSGHLAAKQDEVTLSIVWHGELLDQLLSSPSSGTRE